MNRARVLAATFVSATMLAGGAFAGQSQAPLKPVLAGKKIVPPLRGEANIEFTQPVTKPLQGKNLVQTTIKVKNASAEPIARLMVAETWYDGSGAIVAGGRGVINGMLQPGEVQTITIETPVRLICLQRMKTSSW